MSLSKQHCWTCDGDLMSAKAAAIIKPHAELNHISGRAGKNVLWLSGSGQTEGYLLMFADEFFLLFLQKELNYPVMTVTAAAAHVTVSPPRAVDAWLLCLRGLQGDREAAGWSLSGHTDSQACPGALLLHHTPSPTLLHTLDTWKPKQYPT